MKTTSVRHILMLLCLISGSLMSHAQHEDWTPDFNYPGRYHDNPIRLKMPPVYYEYTDSANTFDWCLHKFYHETVHYTISISGPTRLLITTHGSELKEIGMRVGHIVEPGDTVWSDAGNSPQEYINHLIDAGAWQSNKYDVRQPLWAQTMHPGTYAVEVHGIYSQAQGTSNGLLVTSFIGSPLTDSIKRAMVPAILLQNTLRNPEWLMNMPTDTDYAIYREKEISEAYINARENFDGKVYYKFGLTDTANIRFSTKEYGTQLWIWPADSVPADISSPPTDNNGWPLYCSAKTIFEKRMPPGQYLISASDTLSPKPGTTIGFILERFTPPPPPPPPYWEEYAVFSPEVAGKNYVRERVMLDEGGSEWAETTTYYDGLGRQSQTVVTDGSPAGGDLVTHTDYDIHGRVWRQWLPAAGQGGGSYTRHSDIDYTGVYGNDQRPFAETVYEPSALDRPAALFDPGDDIYNAGAAVRNSYGVNHGSGGAYALMAFSVSDTPDAPGRPVKVSCLGLHPKGELTYAETTDGDGRRSIVFTDPFGRKVLERADMADGTFADTYYIYDSYGNLTAVLSPEASTRVSAGMEMVSGTSDILDGYCHVYAYNRRGLMVSRRRPGSDTELMRYDSTDRLILSQDGELRRRGLWRFTIGDVFGRECLTGTCRSLMFDEGQSTARARRVDLDGDGHQGTLAGYAVEGCTLEGAVVLTAIYHDDYSFLGRNGVPGEDMLGFRTTDDVTSRYGNTRGQITGRLTAVPLSPGSDSLAYLATAIYYDHRDRVVQTVAMNHLGGIDRRSTAYDFAGRPIGSTIEHSTAAMADSTVVQRWRHSFDRHGRELSASLRLGPGQWQAISGKEYDAVGRLGSETIGEPDRHICRTYAYDIRSNPVSVSSYGYRQKLSFTPGGNISRMTWWAYGPNETERTYEFTYDALARLTSAGYSDANGKRGLFDTSYSYDLNGNITALRRSGLYDTSYYGDRYGLVDDLTYSYSGNQVTAIADACAGPFYYGAYHFADGADLDVEYTYDANGNMTADLNRGITSMAYDLNNRPSAIEFSSGASVSYIYDADGRKLRTIRSIPSTPPAVAMESVDGGEAETTVTDYCGDYIYEDGAIERINTPAGYLSFRDNYGDRLDTPRHIFFLRDHLGNNRVALDGSNGAIMQINHYYPFGMPMNAGLNTGFQPWKFGGKEFDRTAGLDLYDFEARAYDPSTARFIRHDDFTEKYLPLSPYTYCANNPLINIDTHGDSITVLSQPDGAMGFGHMAIMIQDENGTWSLYSKNGTTENYGAFGNADHDDNGGQEYSSPESFLNSNDNLENGKTKYTQAYVIPSTKDEDATAINAVTKELEKKHYNVATANCAQLVQKGLRAIGKNDGHATTKDVITGYSAHKLLGYSLYPYKISKTMGPNQIFKRIVENNSGRLINK